MGAVIVIEIPGDQLTEGGGEDFTRVLRALSDALPPGWTAHGTVFDIADKVLAD